MWPNWGFSGSQESTYQKARTNTPPRTQLLSVADSFSFCLSRPMAFTQSHTSATTEAWDVGSNQTNGQGTGEENPTTVNVTLTSA